MGTPTNEIISEIKNSLDIAEIIGEHVRLKTSTRGYTGLCPFHEERTPSFYVYEDTQTYYCFGCHEAGDIFTFVMKTEGLEFFEALEILAARAGIKLPTYEKKEKQSGEKNSYEIFDLASKFYTKNLRTESGIVAQKYMEQRKLDEKDIAKFSLGYAPASWDSLVRYLKKIGISEKRLLNLGLAVQGKKGIYDTFRGRLIFPIKNISGKVIAFGGRLIDGEGAKYINSSENEIYTKRKNLYLLDIAKKSIREKKRSILVEGYMDAIRLHKCGFTEAVASCGTALTSEQAGILSRFADRCYICYDSDKAGQNATLRGMYILAQNGLDVHVVNLPEGKDPDDFLSVNPPEKFEDVIKNSLPLVLHQLKISTPAMKDQSTRKSARKELFENLLTLNIANVLQYKIQLSEVTGIPPSKIEEWFTSKQKNFSDENIVQSVKNENVDLLLEAGLCYMLRFSPACKLKINPEDICKIFYSELAQNIASGFLGNDPESMINLWRSMGSSAEIKFLIRGEQFCYPIRNLSVNEQWRKIFGSLQARAVSRRIRELTKKLQASQATPQELSELRELKRRSNQGLD